MNLATTDPTRRAATAVSVLLLVATASVLAGDALRPALTGTGSLESLAGQPVRLSLAALCYLLAAGTSVGIAVALYPVLRRVGPAQALGAVVLRTVEAVFYTVAVVSLISVRPLAEQLATAAAGRREQLQLAADSLVQQRDHAVLVAVFAFSAGALLYYLPLHRARLVPRGLSGWGVAGVAAMLTACVLALFADRPVTDYWPLALPIACQEVALAIWLLVKGFAQPETDQVRLRFSPSSGRGRSERRKSGSSSGAGPR